MLSVSASARPTFGLNATGLTRLYGETVALWRVDVRAGSRELVAVHGPNASGKSTLLRILAGLTAPTRGSVSWTAIAGGSPPRRAFVGHASHLYEALTPLENLRLAAELAGADTHDLLGILERLGLEAEMAVPCRALSAGTIRRAAIGRAIAVDPDVLLIDEPFAAQDARAADVVAAALKELKAEGRLILIASHDDMRSRAIATRIMTLDHGRVDDVRRQLTARRSDG